MRSSDDPRPRSTGHAPGIAGFAGGSSPSRIRALLAGAGILAALGAASPVLRSAPADASGPAVALADRPLPGSAVSELPLEVNERVRYWIERFSTDERPTFEAFMSREGVYGDLIRRKLLDRGMPEELLYLAMIESGFSPEATSNVAAVGLWQFMGPTARQYGLRVDEWVDERRDPIRATDAALEYLQWLHDRYDSWYLAAAAYNAGPGRVDRALARRGDGPESDADLYWQIIDHLPRETRQHVPRMLAVMHLARNTGEYGFEIERRGAYAFDRVWVPGGTPLRVVARALEIPTRQLRDLNPHLVRGVTPPGGTFGLRVPPGRSAAVVASLGGGPWGARRADDD